MFVVLVYGITHRLNSSQSKMVELRRMKMFYEGHLKSSGNSVLFRKRGKKLSKCIYIFRYINISSTNQTKDHLDIPHAACAGQSQDRSLL